MRAEKIRPVFQSVSRGVFPFSPSRLFASNEPGVWYDFSDQSTLFQDRAGTIPLTATGQPLGHVRDKSGRGNHLTAVSDLARGLYQVDEAGLPYVLCNGSNTGYVTPTITPGTNKAQIFAGVRKLSDAAFQGIAEMSINPNTNTGSFSLSCGTLTGDPSRRTWSSVISGSALGIVGGAAVYPSPDTRVVSIQNDLSFATAPEETIMRLNGVQQTLTFSPGTPGTGNFNAYPLYVGARGGTTAPFNGRIYSLIVRFGPNLSAQRIRQVEHWVAGKTGVVL